MACPRCKNKYIPTSAQYCPRCGQRLSAPRPASMAGIPPWAVALIAAGTAAVILFCAITTAVSLGLLFQANRSLRAARMQQYFGNRDFPGYSLPPAMPEPALPRAPSYDDPYAEEDPYGGEDPYGDGFDNWEDWYDYWGDLFGDDWEDPYGGYYDWYPGTGYGPVVPYEPGGDDSRLVWPPSANEGQSGNPYSSGWAAGVKELYEPGEYYVGHDLLPGDYVLDTRDRAPTGYEDAWLFYQAYKGDDYEEGFITWRFIRLEENDIISFGNAWMYPLEYFQCDVNGEEVLPEGSYRIGVDIPAGEYEAVNLPGESGDFLLQDDMRLSSMMLLEAETSGILRGDNPKTFVAEEGYVLYLSNATMQRVD